MRGCPLPEGGQKTTAYRNHIESSDTQRGDQPGRVATPPLSGRRLQPSGRYPPAKQVEEGVDTFDQDEFASAYLAHSFERADGIAQMDEERSAEDDIKAPVNARVEVIYRARKPLGARSENPTCDFEPDACARSTRWAIGLAATSSRLPRHVA